MRRRAKIILGKQLPESAVIHVAKWIMVTERLVLVTFLGPFECFPALLASKRLAIFLVFIPLIRIGEGLIALSASIFVSIPQRDTASRHMEVVPRIFRWKAPATQFAFEGDLLIFRMLPLFMLSVFC
jgi:hypothetical protein